MKWINVEDRLPEHHEVSIIFDGKYKTLGFGYLTKSLIHIKNPPYWMVENYNYLDDGRCDDVTHWMPLPKPPKD